MAVCVVFGLINGGLVTGIGLPAFIVTLGTYNIAFALVRIYTTSTVTSLPDILLFSAGPSTWAARRSATARW